MYRVDKETGLPLGNVYPSHRLESFTGTRATECVIGTLTAIAKSQSGPQIRAKSHDFIHWVQR